jgi:hypothetical protein
VEDANPLEQDATGHTQNTQRDGHHSSAALQNIGASAVASRRLPSSLICRRAAIASPPNTG